MLIWAALMLCPSDLPISCMCAYKHVQPSLSKREEAFFFTKSKRDFVKGLAPCICTEISVVGATAYCSKHMHYFRVQSRFLMAG